MHITPLPAAPSRADPTTFAVKGDALLGALASFVSEVNAVAEAMNLNDTSSTSTTSLAIGIGSKILTVDTGKSYLKGMSVKIAYTTAPTNWMHGDVTSYNSGTGELIVNVTSVLGGGTYAAWTVSFSAPMETALTWTQTAGTFTATPASTSTLTMTSDLTATIKAGMSLKYVIGGVTKYGRVSAITSGLLTVNGAPLSGDVTALYYGGGRVRQVVVTIPATYEDASNTALIASDLHSSLVWKLPVSYLVHFGVYSNAHDSGTHGQASVRIDGTEVCTTAGGLTIAADATWYNTVVDIDVAAYDINPGEAVEVTAVKGENGDATDLTVEMIFITP